MAEGFTIRPAEGKNVATFPEIEMVPGGPILSDVPAAITEIRESGILGQNAEGNALFGEFNGLVTPKEGVWPELNGMPQSVKTAFNAALAAERMQNPGREPAPCYFAVRVQGDEKVRMVKEYYEKLAKEGREIEDSIRHFDTDPGGAPVSEYLISFTGPATIQHLGETDLPPGELNEAEVDAALAKAPLAHLVPASVLPNHLYHMTNRTPHSEPTTLEENVSDEKPRLFMRFMFGHFDSSQMLGTRFEV